MKLMGKDAIVPDIEAKMCMQGTPYAYKLFHFGEIYELASACIDILKKFFPKSFFSKLAYA